MRDFERGKFKKTFQILESMKYGKWSLDGCRVDLNKHNGTPSNVRETNQYKQLMALTLFTTQRNNLETLTRARTSCSVSRDVTSLAALWRRACPREPRQRAPAEHNREHRRVRAQHVTSLLDTPMIMSTTLLNDRTLASSDIYANMANGPWYATSAAGQRTADSGQNGNLPTLRLCDDASSFAISQRVASPLTHSHLVPNC